MQSIYRDEYDAEYEPADYSVHAARVYGYARAPFRAFLYYHCTRNRGEPNRDKDERRTPDHCVGYVNYKSNSIFYLRRGIYTEVTIHIGIDCLSFSVRYIG